MSSERMKNGRPALEEVSVRSLQGRQNYGRLVCG